MLSKLIKDKIEAKFGQEIRYPKECEALAAHISSTCRTRISASTLRRLYGFNPPNEPRLHTLDIIAAYLGFKTWQHLIQSFDKNTVLDKTIIHKTNPRQLKKGSILKLTYESSKTLELEKTGNQLEVIKSNDKQLVVGDILFLDLVELEYPLSIRELHRANSIFTNVKVATVSGITSITII